MPRKTPQDKRAGKAAKKAAKARKPATGSSRPAARKAVKKAARKADGKKAGGKKAGGKKAGRTTGAPAVKKARAAKAARRAAAKKAVARKSASGKPARKSARTAAGKPQPAPRRTAPRISAGRRATPRKTASREALVKKTVTKKTAPGNRDARAPRLAGKTVGKSVGKTGSKTGGKTVGKTAGKVAGARRPADKDARKRAAGKAKAGEAPAAGARSPGHGAGKPARKTARARILGRASQKLAPPVLRDGTRRRVEKPTAPRPEKAPAPARKQPFRAHALGVREEHATDRPRIEALLTQAFGRPEEARIVQELRDSGDMVCALVAEYEGDIVGYIGFSRVDAQIDGRAVKAAALAPLAVAPARQGRGVGSVLVSSGLEAVGAAGLHAVFVAGDEAYYERFGFSTEAAAPYESPWKAALLALELEPQALAGSAGTLVHPAALRP